MNPQGTVPSTEKGGFLSPAAGPPSTALAAEFGPGNKPNIPDFELLRRIGRGAYGEVFLARNLTGSCVAVKVVTRGAFDHDRPFEREFEGIRYFEPISRSDPSQVAVLHVGRAEGFFYYAMELADAAEATACDSDDRSDAKSTAVGKDGGSQFSTQQLRDYRPHTLREDLKSKGCLPVADCVEIGVALARALGHLHERGLVHRDVKPSNVIFIGGVPKLADIGLMTSIDATRSMVGTDGYAAPEGPGTPQADLYSLGKLLYEISTGCDRKQFPALPPDIATRANREMLIELNAIIMRACQFNPSERHADAKAMLAELQLLQRGDSVQRKRKLRDGLKLLRKAAVATAAVAMLAIGASFWGRWSAPAEIAYPDGPPSTNDEANALCAKALLILRGDNQAGLAEAYTNFQRAINLDPNFAKPYVGLFELRTAELIPGLPLTTAEELRGTARRLKELAPGLGAAYCIQSMLDFYNLDFMKALENARESVRVDPNYEYGHLWRGFILIHIGRPVEGRAEVEKAKKIAPSKGTVYRALGHSYYVQRDFTNAMKMYREAIWWQPYEYARLQLGLALQATGDFPGAINCFEQMDILRGGDETAVRKYYDGLRAAFTDGGRLGYWRARWDSTARKMDQDSYDKAYIRCNLGDTNGALMWLNKCYDKRERNGIENRLTYLIFDECWDGLRGDPKFKQLLDKTGFTKVMPSDRR